MLIFVPYVIAEVIVGTGFSLMLATNGALNGFLEKVGLGWLAQDWLSDPQIAIWTLMAILTWKYIGLRRHPLPRRTPGDSRRSCTRRPRSTARPTGRSSGRITLPLLGPTLRIWAFLSIIGALQLFDLVYIIWGQYVSSVAGTITMATYMVANGRNAGNFGYGNAVAVVIFVISLVGRPDLPALRSCAVTPRAPSQKGASDELHRL